MVIDAKGQIGCQTTGRILMIRVKIGLERKKIIAVSYNGLERQKICFI